MAWSTVPTSLTTMLVALLMPPLVARLAAALAAELAPPATLVALLVARDPKLPQMLERPLRSVSLLNSPRASRWMRCSPPVRPPVMRCIHPSADARSPASELQRPPGPASPSGPLLLSLLQRG